MSAAHPVGGAIAYEEIVGRNAGFLSPDEQARLRGSAVFVCGLGGMGGAAATALARAGLGRIGFADPDAFEASNLNRQAFATVGALGMPKSVVARDALLAIRPDLALEDLGEGWLDGLGATLARYPVVVNAMDDPRAGIRLYREARACGATVIDAYTAPMPSVSVVRPGDPLPEERLGFPTVGVPWPAITEEQLRACREREIAFVLGRTSALDHFDLEVAEEIVRGERPRSSFAPVVTIAGTLMAFEAILALLGRPSAAGHAGYLFNPWTARVERPASGRIHALAEEA